VEKRVRLNGEQIPLNSSRCEGIEEDENTIKILSGEHLTHSKIYLEDTRGELGYT